MFENLKWCFCSSLLRFPVLKSRFRYLFSCKCSWACVYSFLHCKAWHHWSMLSTTFWRTIGLDCMFNWDNKWARRANRNGMSSFIPWFSIDVHQGNVLQYQKEDFTNERLVSLQIARAPSSEESTSIVLSVTVIIIVSIEIVVLWRG